MPTCTSCHIDKPLDAFYKHKKSKSGYANECKDCAKSRVMRWRAENSERYLSYNKGWEQEHPDKVKSYKRTSAKRAYYANIAISRAYLRQRSIAFYYRHRQRRLDYAKQYRKRLNKDRRRQYLKDYRLHSQKARQREKIYQQNRRAREMQAVGTHNQSDIDKQYARQHGKCYWCGNQVGKTYHVDHVIPLSRGGSNSADNLVIACPHCNESKGGKLPHEWDKNNGKMF